MSALPWIFVAAAGIATGVGLAATHLNIKRWRRERLMRAEGFDDVSPDRRRENLRDGVP